MALIDITLWLIETTSQFMARDAQAVALNAFAHAPLPELLALCPAAVPMALPEILPSLVIPSLVLPIAPAPEILDDVAPVLALCPTLVPIAFSSFVPDDSVHRCAAPGAGSIHR